VAERHPGVADKEHLRAVMELEQRVADLATHPKRLLIGGTWVEAASGRTFTTVNPATGEPLAEIAWGEA
jgi:phenylacetaldehyde dehydrogenase